MSQGLIKKGLLSGAVAAAAFAAAPTQSDAAFTYDMRFAPGGTAATVQNPDGTVTIGSTGTVFLQLWALVSGTDGNVANEGLQHNYIQIQSEKVGVGGIQTATMTLTGGGRVAPFNQDGRNGSTSNITPDSIGDWGSVDPLITHTGYMQARAFNPARHTDTTNGNVVDANTYAFHVSTFRLSASALADGTGSTRIAVVKPTAQVGQSQAYVVYYDDAPLVDHDQSWDPETNSPSPNPATPDRFGTGSFGPPVDHDNDPETPNQPVFTYVAGGSTPVYSDGTPASDASIAGVYGDYVEFLSPTVIPEPTSLALLGLTGLGLLSRRRRD